MKRLIRFTLGCLTAAMIPGLQAQSDSYTLPWATIDGGGGLTSGGSFSLHGTVGQPDAGVMSGGAFTITGGFWSLPLSSGPLPSLSIRYGIGSTVILSWPNPSSSYVLQQTADMNAAGGGWMNVSQTPVINGANKEVTLTATGRFCLFRLRRL